MHDQPATIIPYPYPLCHPASTVAPTHLAVITRFPGQVRGRGGSTSESPVLTGNMDVVDMAWRGDVLCARP